MKKYVCFLSFFIISICVNAQVDTTFVQADTISPIIDTTQIEVEEQSDKKFSFKRKKPKPEVPLLKRIMKPEKHSPLSATVYSLALPGAGQVYNKKYWKLPIVYGGLGWMGYRINRTTRIHRIYRDAYVARIDEDPTTVDTLLTFYTDSNLDALRLSSKKQQELAIIGFAAVYILVAADAFVDAHLWSFDVNDDLSMGVGPALLPPTTRQPASLGVSLQLRTKAPPKPTPLSILTE